MTSLSSRAVRKSAETLKMIGDRRADRRQQHAPAGHEEIRQGFGNGGQALHSGHPLRPGRGKHFDDASLHGAGETRVAVEYDVDPVADDVAHRFGWTAGIRNQPQLHVRAGFQ